MILTAFPFCGKSANDDAVDFEALENGDLTSLETYLENDGNPNLQDSTTWSLLHFAARWGDNQLVTRLIEKGADVNILTSDKWTPLFYASLNGHTETVRFLIAKGADVNAKDIDGNTALDVADNEDIEEILRTSGSTATQE